MSKAAWGSLQLEDSQIHTQHWELGVLFTPKSLSNAPAYGGDKLDIADGGALCELVTTASWEESNAPGVVSAAGVEEVRTMVLPIPYELPPRYYPDGAKPWVCDVANWPPDKSGETNCFAREIYISLTRGGVAGAVAGGDLAGAQELSDAACAVALRSCGHE